MQYKPKQTHKCSSRVQASQSAS